jgi:hydrogenase nickel incorporation protein HypA/HybF
MHEWALAESVIVAALDEAKKEHLKQITEIIITIGELQQIEEDIFTFAIDEVIKSQTPELKNTKITIRMEPSTLTCNKCQYTWKFRDVSNKLNEAEAESVHFIPEVMFVHMRCPNCNSPDFEITKGRGVTIQSIKGKR